MTITVKGATVLKISLFLVTSASAASAEIYTWRDSRGVTHYSNSEYDIPARYRDKAKVLDLDKGARKDPLPTRNVAPSTPGEEGSRLPPPPAANTSSPTPGRVNSLDGNSRHDSAANDD